MAKRHCAKHKRYVHNCIGCQSEALKETVGFPGGRTFEATAEIEDGNVVSVSPVVETTDEPKDNIPDWESDEEEQEGPTAPLDPPILDETPPADETASDIAEWEPEVENDPEPAPLPTYVPAGETETLADIDETEEAMAAEGEFDIPPLSPMSAEDAAMALFPRRLIPEGATEVCDEERPDEPYMASYEELIRRAIAGYLEMGLSPEDANIVVAAEVIQAEKMSPDFQDVYADGGEATDREAEEDEEFHESFDAGFESGIESAPGLTGCIEDYNQGFNAGMAAVVNTLRGYYAGDEDAPAYSMLQWLEAQMAGMKK